ncbi:MAG: hypothetical protein JWM23_561 [Microbacteriaceae bacterium]|nr:hypothetical protein [Microbacteriaceae bacterium]
MSFTCGLRIWCTRCHFHACANPDHKEYRGEGPHEAMTAHKASAHPEPSHSGTHDTPSRIAENSVH